MPHLPDDGAAPKALCTEEESRCVAREFDRIVRMIRREAEKPVGVERAHDQASAAMRAVRKLVVVLPKLPTIGGALPPLSTFIHEAVDLRFVHPAVRAVVLTDDREEMATLIERSGKICHAHGYASEALLKAMSAARWAQAPRADTRRFALWDVQDTLIRSAFAIRELAGVVPLMPLATAVIAAYEELPR
jgi:hypothetical protein